MSTKSDLRRAFTRVESLCGECRLSERPQAASVYAYRGLGCHWDHRRLMLALFLPSVRTSREAARRNSCICNLKQLSIAIQNHHDTRKYPPDGLDVAACSGRRHSAIRSGGQCFTDVQNRRTNWTAGQQGDGYSWIAQCLPFMEENTLYEKMTAVRDEAGRAIRKTGGCSIRSIEQSEVGGDCDWQQSVFLVHEDINICVPELSG